MKPIERRTMKGTVTLRAAAANERPRLGGRAAVYNSETVIAGLFRERIMPGAFAGVLDQDVRSLYNHDPNYVLGRRSAGTLLLTDGAEGLDYDVEPPATRADVVESVQRGDVTGSSFGFVVAPNGDEWIRPASAGDLPLRVIHEFAELRDVGPVAFPAYVDTSAEARGLDEVVPAEVRSAAAAAAQLPAADDQVTGDVEARERARRELAILDAEAGL